MTACREYRNAPNPQPKPVVTTMWALSNEKGQFRKYTDGQILLKQRKPDGFFAAFGEGTFKPRKVRVTIEAITR